MAVFKTLAFLFILSFEIYETSAVSDVNSSFSFNGFAKSPVFYKNIALYGDSKLVNDGPSIQLTNSVSHSQGRVIYKRPIKLFQGKERNFSGSFSTSFSFSMSSKEIGSVLAFVMVPSGLDLRFFSRKDNNTSSGLGFLLQHKIVAVEFGISKSGNHVRVLVGKQLNSSKIRNLSSSGERFNLERNLKCWIDYEASSKRIEVRLGTGIKPVDPFVSYLVDLAKLWKDGRFMVGLVSINGNSSKQHYLHSWSFHLRHPSMMIHSQPLDPNEVSKTVNEEEDGDEEDEMVGVKGKTKCIWKTLGALVLGAVCGTLGAVFALYLWTICGNMRSMAIVPEECAANEKSDIVVMTTDVDDEESKK